MFTCSVETAVLLIPPPITLLFLHLTGKIRSKVEDILVNSRLQQHESLASILLTDVMWVTYEQ